MTVPPPPHFLSLIFFLLSDGVHDRCSNLHISFLVMIISSSLILTIVGLCGGGKWNSADRFFVGKVSKVPLDGWILLQWLKNKCADFPTEHLAGKCPCKIKIKIKLSNSEHYRLQHEPCPFSARSRRISVQFILFCALLYKSSRGRHHRVLPRQHCSLIYVKL